MSAHDHNSEHNADDHGTANQKPEVTNPFLWTIALLVFVVVVAAWFLFWISKGQNHGLANPKTVASTAVVAEVPDHAALIKDVSPAMLARGKEVFMANCATCHGPKGTPVIPNARNFNKDVFKNDVHGKKANPWTMFNTVTHGFNGGAMPPRPDLSVKDRYAAIHYIRQTFVKKNNPSQYVTIEEALKADFPKPAKASGEAEASGPNPATLPVTIPVYAVLAQESKQNEQAFAESKQYLQAVQIADSDTSLRPALTAVKHFAGTQLGAAIVENIQHGSEDVFSTLLLKPEVAEIEPIFGSLSKDDFHNLYLALAVGRANRQE